MDIFRDIPPQTSLHTVVCLMSIIDRRAAAVDPLDYQFLSDYHTEKKNSPSFMYTYPWSYFTHLKRNVGKSRGTEEQNCGWKNLETNPDLPFNREKLLTYCQQVQSVAEEEDVNIPLPDAPTSLPEWNF